MAQFHLLIDDVRIIDCDHTARNARDGIKALKSFPVTHLYLDHDLGDVDEPSGYDVLNMAIERNCLPPNVFLITANPVGRDRMVAALKSAGYVKKNHWYIKEL